MDQTYDGPAPLNWTFGLVGGLVAAVVYTLFETFVAGSFEHRASFSEIGAYYASSVAGAKADPQNGLFVALGYAIFVLVALFCGILYTMIALRIGSMVRTPTSLVWGLLYGLCIWLVLANLVVPVLGMTNTQPLWEALVGSTICFGYPISECVTLLVSSRSRSAS